MKKTWPKTVPVLTKEDMHKYSLDSSTNKKHCLVGWKIIVFPNIPLSQTDYIYNCMFVYTNNKNITEYNDAHSLEENANVWNKTMHDLGYTENV